MDTRVREKVGDGMNSHVVADVREQVRVMENIRQALQQQTTVLNDRAASEPSLFPMHMFANAAAKRTAYTPQS